MYEIMESNLPPSTVISFDFNRAIHTDIVQVRSFNPEVELRKNFPASVVWNEGGSNVGLGLSPIRMSSAPIREKYNEDEIIADTHFEGRSAKFEGDLLVPPLKIVIAMNKVLLSNLLKPLVEGQWLFTRLELNAVLPPRARPELEFHSSRGLSAIVTKVQFDSGQFGIIQFAWGRIA